MGEEDWSAIAARCRREARRVLRDPHAAEEAAQAALVRAWLYRESLRKARKPDPWLSALARNVALDERARELARRERESDHTRLGLGVEDHAFAQLLDTMSLEGLLAPLPARDRDYLRMRFIDDLTYDEIARLTGTPVSTIRVRVHRLRDRLKTLLESRYEPT